MATGFFKKLEGSAEKFVKKIPKFWQILLGMLFSALLAIIANRLSDGRGLMIVIASIAVAIFGVAVHICHLHAKKKKVAGFFWSCFACGAAFFITLTMCKIIALQYYRTTISSQSFQLNWFTNEMAATNVFYTDLTNALNHRVLILTEGYLGKGNVPPEALGLHEVTVTNTINETVTNVVISTNFLTVGLPQTNYEALAPFVFDYFQLKRLNAKFSQIKPTPIAVVFHNDDIGAVIISKQICQVLVASGFDATLRAQALSFPFKGITIASEKPLTSDPIWSGFIELFMEYSQAPQTDIEAQNGILGGQIWILVATDQRFVIKTKNQ